VTSFPAQARRVRDAELPLQRRLLALRECVVHFGPYGFRATWHHLLVTARLPHPLEDDPDSLLRAISELDEARQLWLECSAAYRESRRQEKAMGRRTPRSRERWYSWAGQLAYCPDPTRHPSERLAAVVQRVIEAYSSDEDWSARCPVCGHSRSSVEACPRCGVDPRGPAAPLPHDIRTRAAYQWRHIWRRTAYEARTSRPS
jgi:hypothetical protein